MEMNRSMDIGKYLFSSFSASEGLVAFQIIVSTAAALVLGSTCSTSWSLLLLSVGGLFVSVFLVTMFVISLQVTGKRKEVAIIRALGAKRSSLLRLFLQRVAALTLASSLVGTVVGYCIASFSIECSFLSVETAVITLAVFFASSFGGGFTAAKKLSGLEIGEVLRQ
jgi:ABC-type antimicrobial peptide transport system permease subunit